MIRKIVQSFLLAFQNIRSNFFHTFLSILGIVIGVGALVSILSLIDGMEQYAKDQIATTTSLNMLSVQTETVKRVNGMTIRKDSATVLQVSDYNAIKSRVRTDCYIYNRQAREVSMVSDTVKGIGYVTGVIGLKPDSVLAGRFFSDAEIQEGEKVALLTETMAKTWSKNGKIDDVLGKQVSFLNRTFTVIGVVFLKNSQAPELFYPLSSATPAELRGNPPQLLVEVGHVEDVPVLKKQITEYFTTHYPRGNDFLVVTNEFRVEQAAQGFFLFRVIMGLIVGISVVVGGIGIMNVLLISVTERTAEIGIRKALGANRRDIILLFLSESITVSAFGSFVGLIFGTLFTMAAIPIVKSLTKIPFQAAYTLNTFIIISILAIIVGIVFGTYPAIRASRLNPVDAIRHE